MHKAFKCLIGRVVLLFSLAFCFWLVAPNAASAAAVTLSPAAGVSGQVVIISGSGFDNSSAATILWDNAALTTAPSSVTTSAAGAIPTTGTVSFVVPSAMYGAHTVKIRTGTTNVAIATFTINTPTVATTSPVMSFVSGVTVTAIASNIEAMKSTNFYFDDLLLGTSTSTENGTAEYVFTVPTQLQNVGSHIIRASNSSYAVASITVTLAAPTLTLNPATGAIGTKVTATGLNFRAGGEVSFFLNGESFTPDAAVTANGAGSFTAVFTVPDAAAGANTIKAQSDSNLYATAAYTVATPALILMPTSGTGGLAITASGTGFRANSTVNFFVNDEQIDTTATTNNFGAFRQSIGMPGDFPVGAQTVRAQTDLINFALATYTVTAAAVTASPAAGVPGTQVTLTGTNFDPNETVTIKWNGEKIKTTKSNNSGSFLTKITIPADYVSGNGQIEAYTSDVARVLITFTIANPTLTLSPASGLPGTELTVTGTNFSGRKELQLLWDDGKIVTRPKKIMTTPLGGFVAIFTVPNSSRGVHSVVAQTLGSNEKINISAMFTVTAPSVTSSITTGQANTSISLYGTGFLPRKEVKFSWDNDKDLKSDPEKVIADDSGYFSATVTLPEGATPGNHIVKVFSNQTAFTTFSFTVTTGTITLSKENGAPHTSVQVTGSGFDASSSVRFFWDNEIIEMNSVETDSIGGFATTIVLPTATSGMHALRAETSEFSSATTDFGIDAPVLTINPSTANSRGEIVLSGMNFVSGRKVIVSVNDQDVKTQGEAMVDNNGNFSTSIRLPFTFSDSVRITVRTGDEDRVIVVLPVSQMAIVTAVKNYGEWAAIVLFLIGAIFVAQKFGIPEKGLSYVRNVFAKDKKDPIQ